MGKKLKKVDELKQVNERLMKNYGKNNRQMSSSTSVEPGTPDTPALKALRMGANTYRTDYKKTVPPSGRMTMEQYTKKKGVKGAAKSIKKKGNSL